MAYFPDLSPYAYGYTKHTGVAHIGWLSDLHPFLRGVVAPHLIEKLRKLATNPVELYRGYHLCELCPQPDSPVIAASQTATKVIVPGGPYDIWMKCRRSNGEIRVSLYGVTYAAPVLIVHYIEEHHYLPPAEFLEAVEAAESL